MDIDLLDRRGRLVRLVAAGTIGLGVTLLVMYLISDVGRRNADPISQIGPFALGLAMFAVVSSLAFAGLAALNKRVR